MKKIFLASTCAMAFAIGASGLAFAQGTQRNDEKTGAGQEQMQSGGQHKATGQPGERMNGQSPRAETQSQSRENRAAAESENKNGANAAQGEMNKENKNRSNAATEQEKKNPSNAAAEPENKNRSNAAQGEMKEDKNRSNAAQGEMKEDKNRSNAAQGEMKENKNRSNAAQGEMKENKNRSNAATEQENKNRSNAQGEMNKNAPMNAQEEKNGRPGETRTQSGQANQREMNEQPKGTAQGSTTGGQERNEANAQTEGRVKLNQTQATDFRSRIEKHGGANVTIASNVDVRIGAPIPESVRFEPLPPDIVSVYPQFRGYDYVMRGDEIVIIQPRTREVVEIIGGEGRAAAEPSPRRHHFSREQDEIFHRDIHVNRTARVEFDERRMERVPDTVVLEPLPPDLVEAVPDVREYRYFVDLDDHIIVVDPQTREVVDVID